MKNTNISLANKTVLIINGRSGVGKDTLCDIAAKQFKVRNISSVDKVKEIARIAGWDGVKDERGRKLLIDIKKALVEYDNLPTRYMAEQYKDFIKSEDEIMFVHIREPEEIAKLQERIPCKTILVTRKAAEKFNLSNDDNVTKFKYNFTFENDKPINESGEEFIKLIQRLIRLSVFSPLKTSGKRSAIKSQL